MNWNWNWNFHSIVDGTQVFADWAGEDGFFSRFKDR